MMKATLKTSWNCIIDLRVSTTKQLSGSGLDNQEDICTNFANSKNWHILDTYSKAFSGRKEEREDFEDIITQIQKWQRDGVPVHYYLVKSIDRLTRDGERTYGEMKSRLSALGVRLVDVYGVIQEDKNTLEYLGLEYDWSRYTPSETSEVMEAIRGKAEVRDILTRMIGAEITQTRKGFSMRKPNDGYLNTKEIIDGRERSVLMQDEKRSHFFKTIFEMRASGRFGDKEIASKVNALGYLSKPRKIHSREGKQDIVIGHTTPRPLTVKQLQKLIQRTIYAGVKNEKWNSGSPVPAVFASDHKPIVSVEVFNKANRGKVYIKVSENKIEVLKDYDDSNVRAKTRKKYNPLYKYDKMVHCHYCLKPMKNSGNKGNVGKSGEGFPAYHCDRIINEEKHYFRVPKRKYENEVAALLSKIEFNDGFKQRLEERLIKKYREREKEVLGQSITIGENVTELKKQQESLLEDFGKTNSDIVRRSIEQKVELLEKQITKAVEERDKIEIRERDVKSFVKYATDLVEHPVKMLENNSNPYKQRALFDLVFDEPLTYDQIVNGTPRLSFIFKLKDDVKGDKSPMVSL